MTRTMPGTQQIMLIYAYLYNKIEQIRGHRAMGVYISDHSEPLIIMAFFLGLFEYVNYADNHSQYCLIGRWLACGSSFFSTEIISIKSRIRPMVGALEFNYRRYVRDMYNYYFRSSTPFERCQKIFSWCGSDRNKELLPTYWGRIAVRVFLAWLLEVNGCDICNSLWHTHLWGGEGGDTHTPARQLSANCPQLRHYHQR